jgi:hypothetical protein
MLEPATATAPLTVSFDRLPDAVLPEGAAERLRALRQHVADAHSLVPQFEDRAAANAARGDAARHVSRLQAHPSAGGFGLKDDHPSVKAARLQLDRLSDDAKRLDDLYETRAAAWRAASGALTSVEMWLRETRGTVLADYDGPEPKLAKGESLMDGIARLQRRGRELTADAHRIRSAPLPSSHAKAKARAAVEALAQRGAPSMARLVEHDAEIEWPTQQVRVSVLNAQPGATGTAEVPDVLALLTWLHKDMMIKKLDAEVMAEADDSCALNPSEREKREAEVLGDLLAVERDEASLVWRAMMDERLPVEHRSDCAPAAILGVVLANAPRNGSSPGTSPGLSWAR